VSEEVRIRLATSGDAATLAALGRRTFEATFGQDNDPADMQQYLDATFTEPRLASELADPASTFFLAVANGDGSVLGYAKLRQGTHAPAIAGARPIELQRIYVDAPALGTGVGSALMEACVAEAIALGCATIWLGVWEHNPSSIAFYERKGFRRVGEHTFQLGSSAQTDWLMERSLPQPGRCARPRRSVGCEGIS
jgi:ribosomal protein S18 acetylase RimI-like enzyme